MHKVTTFLTFNDQLEEAVNLYTSTFKNSTIEYISRSDEGTAFTAQFTLDGQEFMALNGGPTFSFAEGISLYVPCETQEEVDDLWEKLSAGGEPGRCGWLKDKFGVSWQIIPNALGQLMQGGDPKKSQNVMQAMLGMNKLDISGLQRAYDQE